MTHILYDTTLSRFTSVLMYSSVSIDNVLMLWYVCLTHVNVVIIIYLGWIYSSHVSSKEWIQRRCFYFSRERSQSKPCKQSKCSCTYVILEKLYNWRYNVSLFPQAISCFTNVMKLEFLKKICQILWRSEGEEDTK